MLYKIPAIERDSILWNNEELFILSKFQIYLLKLSPFLMMLDIFLDFINSLLFIVSGFDENWHKKYAIIFGI